MREGEGQAGPFRDVRKKNLDENAEEGRAARISRGKPLRSWAGGAKEKRGVYLRKGGRARRGPVSVPLVGI